MSEVRVVLRLVASSRARASRASSKRTVVLMRQSIGIICQYVNVGMGCPMGVLRRYSIPLTHRTGSARDAAHLAPLCSAPSRSRRENGATSALTSAPQLGDPGNPDPAPCVGAHGCPDHPSAEAVRH